MRALDIAFAVLALRASATRPATHKRRLVPAVGDAHAAMLDRSAIAHDRAALIASLWPAPTRQCVAPPRYEMVRAPAMLGALTPVSWAGPQAHAPELPFHAAISASYQAPERQARAA